MTMEHKDSKANIEEQLRSAIAESEMSTYQISKLSGVTESQLSLFINEKRTLSFTSAAKIAETLGLELQHNPKIFNRTRKGYTMTGRKKTNAETVQQRISHRLSKLRNEGQLPQSDYDFLWKWTHELYKLALGTDGKN